MPESILPDPTRTASPHVGSTTRNGEQLTAERTPGGTLSVPPEQLPRPFGRYELRRLLGRGGMGSVYLAHDAQLDRLVALKMPRPFGDDPTVWRERFLTEARAAATLSHPNICPVHDVGEHDGQPYLTMAFIDGETLAARLRRDGRLPVGEAVGLVAVVARAMAEAHARGIVHRDLKPGNLLLDRRGRPVVTDFGLALRASTADDLRLTLTGVAMGTPAYMPPEQAGGDADAVGPASDVYALGVMLFELLTGRVPFRGRTFGQLLAQIERDPPPLPSALADGVPPALDAVVLTALAKAPADRFPTAAEFADALDQFQAGNHDELASRYGAALAAADVTAPHPRPAPAPPRKRVWPAVAAGLFGFAVLVLSAVVIYIRTDKGDLRVELSDPKADVRVEVNGQEVILDPDGKPVRVRAGENQKVVVTGADFETVSESFDLKRNGQSVVRVTLVPKGAGKDGAVAAVPKVADPPKPPPAPPKPVTFPKDKTLIEAGGWQILTDATKEQMEAWLAERKTAKHSVTWLDVVAVDGKPLYSAAAALDDRRPGWQAMLEVPISEMPPQVMRKKIGTEENYVRSLSSYADGEKVVTCLLWYPGVKRWSYRPSDANLTLLRDQLNDMSKTLGVTPVILRPMPTRDGSVYYGNYGEIRIGGSNRHNPDVPPAGLTAYFDTQRKDGYRPISFAAAGGKDGLTFTVVAEKATAGIDWYAEWDLPAAKLAEATKEKAKAGFRPDVVTAYAWDGAVRYCVVWVKDPPRPVAFPADKVVVKQGEWEVVLNATREQMQAWLDERQKAKHSVLWLDAIEVDRKPLFCAVAALNDRAPKWVALLDTPANDFGTGVTQKQVGANDHPLAVSGYTDATGAKPVIVTLWRQERWPFYFFPDNGPDGVKEAETKLKGGNGVFRVIRPYTVGKGTVFGGFGYVAIGEKASHLLDATEPQLAEFVKARRKDGERVTGLAMHLKDGQPVYTVVGGSFPEKQRAEWRTDHGLTIAQLKEAIATQVKDGYHPASVTAGPWDGAVRYCVVWVKEAKK